MVWRSVRNQEQASDVRPDRRVIELTTNGMNQLRGTVNDCRFNTVKKEVEARTGGRDCELRVREELKGGRRCGG
jgi:hypothetical protein